MSLRRFLLGPKKKIGYYGYYQNGCANQKVSFIHFYSPYLSSKIGRQLSHIRHRSHIQLPKETNSSFLEPEVAKLRFRVLPKRRSENVSRVPATLAFTLTISSAESNEDFKAVAFPGPVLLKRTHHVGEEANDHSQTHDPRGTQGVPKEAWPHAEGSCGIAGCRIGYRSGLGDRKKQNPQIFAFHPNLSGKRKNSLIFLPNSLRNKFLFSFYSPKGGLDLLGF